MKVNTAGGEQQESVLGPLFKPRYMKMDNGLRIKVLTLSILKSQYLSFKYKSKPKIQLNIETGGGTLPNTNVASNSRFNGSADK